MQGYYKWARKRWSFLVFHLVLGRICPRKDVVLNDSYRFFPQVFHSSDVCAQQCDWRQSEAVSPDPAWMGRVSSPNPDPLQESRQQASRRGPQHQAGQDLHRPANSGVRDTHWCLAQGIYRQAHYRCNNFFTLFIRWVRNVAKKPIVVVIE